jgi:hypothetical protein
MLFQIIDEATHETVTTIEASSLEAAEQEANCYAAETGWDREYEYEGYCVIPV